MAKASHDTKWEGRASFKVAKRSLSLSLSLSLSIYIFLIVVLSGVLFVFLCFFVLAWFCGVFCGVKSYGVRPRKHPGKPPAKNPATLVVFKKRDCGTRRRFGRRAVGCQRAREQHVTDIWLLTARWPNLWEQKSWLLSIIGVASSDLGEGDPARTVLLRGRTSQG